MTILSVAEIQSQLDASPMTSFMGIRVQNANRATSTVRFTMPMRPEFERMAGVGQFHGGAIAGFLDTAGDFAVAFLVGGPVPTMNLRVDFLRPATGAELNATATVRKLGRMVAVVDIDVFDTSSKLVAVGRGTFGAAIG